MKGDVLTVQVPFMRVRRGLGVGFQQVEEGGALVGPALPTAVWIARAHVLERTLRACGPGTLEVLAFRLGTTPQRLVLIHALVYLAPDLQEAVLFARSGASRITFESLVRIARLPLWQDQREAWQQLTGAGVFERAIRARNPRVVTGEADSTPQESSRSEEHSASLVFQRIPRSGNRPLGEPTESIQGLK